MGVSFVRTVVLYVCVVTALRIMGKRQLGELQPSELVVAIMISDLASVPMQSKGIPLLDGIVPIFTLVVLELIFSVGIMKSEALRKIITGRPVSIIENGKFRQKEMASLRICIDDILEQLRLAGYSDISQIDSAMIETNGQMSVIPKEKERNITCGDMNVKSSQTHIPYTVIADGILRKKNLQLAGVNKKWLNETLQKEKIKKINDVFFMNVADNRKFFIQLKDGKEVSS